MATYAPAALTLARGQGCWVWDVDDNAYLDCSAGIAVNTLGHAHPALVKALTEQAQQLWHTSNLYHTGPQLALAKALTQATGMHQVFLCNSGTEANEAAIKLVRKVGQHRQGTTTPHIIVFEGAFHGRTLGSLAATPKPAFHAPFVPMLQGFVTVPRNHLGALQAAITPHTVGVWLEPIQGEGGIHSFEPAFLKGLQALCHQHQLVLMADEVQCGMGRTGHLLASEALGLKPDVITLAKGLGGGFPIGALLATEAITQHGFAPGDHGCTFGGNPLACTVAHSVLNTINTPTLLQAVHQRGQQLRQGLETLRTQKALGIEQVRGLGLMLGVQTQAPSAALTQACLQQGLLVVGAGPQVIRFLPPLTINEDEITEALSRFEAALRHVTA